MDDDPETPTGASTARTIIFDKYEMGRLLGRGTFAKVYLAKNLQTSQNVAIKVISKERIREPALIEQIKREISVMRLVRHPNVVGINEVLATKQRIFVVMEYVKGGELFAKVARGRLKEEPSRKFFQQLISAVDYCHSRGVSHRDLKPENLLLDDAGNLKVSDFGLSALAPENHRNDGLLHTRCGTPAYVAPEVLRKKGYDGARADIWSCGVILYVLLAGYLPFQDSNVMKMYTKIFKAEFDYPPWISPDARRVISRLLIPDPNRRISIQGIMKTAWFCKGYKTPIPISIPDDGGAAAAASDDLLRSKSAPPFYNAFEFISSMSSGFDLSNLFENGKKSRSLFTSRCSGSTIVAKLEWLARKANFRVVLSKDYKVRMQGAAEGRKGKLAVTAEVYEVAPEVAVVELSKSAGDTLEYRKFCEEEVRPALKDIVWSWQGETSQG